MKLRITGILLSVLFAFAYTAGAAPVTAEEARLVARGWSLANGATFGDFGAVKSVIAEPAADGGTLWYVVVTEHGAAVVASDDEIEPVIAFIPGCDGSIPEASPLRAMLKRDLTARRAKATAVAKAKLAAAASAAASAEANKWRTLKTIATMKMLNAQGNPATIVRWLDGWNSGDTKVVDGKRIQTLRFWNQTDSPNYFTDDEIFNHYTPLCVNASLGHATCGCVATAGSAVMHYFRMVGREPVTGWCTVGPVTVNDPDYRELTTKGGPYDWSLIDDLDLKSGEPVALSESQLDLLARVASDCGIGCNMNYDADGRGSSGSYSRSLARSFRDVFDIKNVQLVTVDGGDFGMRTDIGKSNYDDIIYNQIRGGAPVVLGIEGHEVVATGYGIDANHTDYTYIFLGWGGANDAWYALPKIDTKATLEGGWYESTFVDELLTMISPDDHFVSVVGRVLQYDGSAAAGAVVTLSDGQVLAADENGYWGTRVAPTADGTGTVTVTFPGCPEKTVGYTIGELARSTDEDNARIASDLAQALPDALEIRLEDPCVRVEGQEFSTLNEALDYVGENLPHDQPAVIEIFREGRFLLEDYTLPFDCIIRSPAGMTNRITRTSGVKLIVGEGCTLTLENIRFNACGRQVLAVANDATLILSGDVAAEEIFLDERATLRLTGTPNPANGYVIDAPAKAARGAFVATYDGAWDDFQHIAGNFANKYDRELRGKAVKLEAGYGVKWEVVPVPTAQAVGSLTQNGETVNFDDLRLLFRMIGETGDAEVVIFGDRELTLTNSVEIAGRKVTVRSKAGLATLNGAGTKNLKNERIGFTVRDGGCLVLDHVTFKDYKVWDRPFVFVDDGTVDFKYGAGLDNVIVGRQIGMTNELGCATFNPVYVKKGTVTIEPGAAIVNCATKPTTVVSGTSIPGHGGAVYLHGEECELELAGEISKCSASDYGGAVYAATGAKIKLSEYANVQDNVTVTTVTSKSDIYIREPDAIVVTGPLKGQRIGVYHAKLANPPTGQQFAIADSAAAMSGAELARTAQVFFNDRKPTLGATTDGAVFVWGEAGTYVEPEALEPPADPWPEPEPDPEPEPEPEPEPGPGPGPGPGPEPTPVECQPFAFTAIVEQADHSWKLTLAPATTYCKYTLKTSDDLVNWTTVGEPKTMQSTDLFEFTVPGEEAKRFWKVIGEDGVEPISE